MLIKIPEGFTRERHYLINTVFKEFLGLEYEIINNSLPEYEIALADNKTLIVQDHFFSKFIDGLNYLDKINVPVKVSYFKNPFTRDKDIPVIYGQPEMEIIEIPQKHIYCKADIFADIFFMLTRWEESVIADKDEYGRFPEKMSLSIRNGIHRRPIVNESVEMLWNMLLFLGYSGSRKKMDFEPVITHDVDEVIRNKNIFKLFRILAGDIILRKKPGLIPNSLKDYVSVKRGVKKDNYDTFDFLMDQSEKINVKSHFYFLSQKTGSKKDSAYSNYDYRYNISDPKVALIIQNILNRSHFIGIHGSYNSYNNNDLFLNELHNLTEIAGPVHESRQHYLRFLPPVTWEIESQNNIKLDSTLGFAEDIGFRCGTCLPYPVFDFIKRQPLDLTELPLTVMEGSVLFLTRDPEDFYKNICSIIDTVKKYNGKFVLLWHTNTFNGYEWEPYQKYYTEIIDYLGKLSN
jgi:hypothetical protein